MAAQDKTDQTKTLSVDELLENQKQVSSAATIEAVTGKPGMVKVTPWIASSGCLCHFAIELPKSAIEHVVPTGQKHPCCGKMLSVVEIKFKDKSEVTLSDVFAQLSTSASTGGETGHGNPMGASRPGSLQDTSNCTWQLICPPPATSPCDDGHEECLSRASNSFDRCMCNMAYAACKGVPYRGPRCIPQRIQ